MSNAVGPYAALTGGIATRNQSVDRKVFAIESGSSLCMHRSLLFRPCLSLASQPTLRDVKKSIHGCLQRAALLARVAWLKHVRRTDDLQRLRDRGALQQVFRSLPPFSLIGSKNQLKIDLPSACK